MTGKNHAEKQRRLIARWLWLCLLMVVVMVAVGGLTRLTGSGLSIVEWKPLHGTIPPLNEQEWLEEFALYQQTPEYQNINFGMELAEFKRIFWWEYAHRLLGRITGLIFAVPLLVFAVKRWLTLPQILGFTGIFILGGAQGFIGWIMVQSGLIDDPRVAPHKLALHLFMALLVGMLLLWQALNFGRRPVYKAVTRAQTRPLYIPVLVAILAIYAQILLGALVAGLDAGLTYNTFPLMDGQLIPNGLWYEALGNRNYIENVTLVQFMHRLGAFVTLGVVIWLSYRLFIARLLRVEAVVLLLLTGVQIGLGIATLLYVVPITLASLHQLWAVLLLAYSVFILWKLRAIVIPEQNKQGEHGL